VRTAECPGRREGKGRERAAGGDGLHDDDATRPWGQRTEGSLATVGPDGGEEERGGAHAHRPAGFFVGAAACSAVGVERARAQAAHLVGLRTGLGSVVILKAARRRGGVGRSRRRVMVACLLSSGLTLQLTPLTNLPPSDVGWEFFAHEFYYD